jgi:Xaa-Pro aminopeptidase
MLIYQKRLERLQNLLKEVPCDGYIVEDPINLFYLTGLNLSTGILFIHAHGAHLLVDSRYYELCKANSPIPVVLTHQQEKAFIDLLKGCAKIKTLAFSSDSTSYNRYVELQNCVQEIALRTNNSRQISLTPAINLVKQLRGIKDAEEIVCLRDAASLGTQGFDFVCSLLKEGITEIQIARELEIFWKQRGSKTVAFDPIIAFGANSSMPHHRAGPTKLRKGDTVLIDIGVNYNHYHSDMTRVVFFQGADPKILSIYEIVKAAQATALALCRPGTLIGDLDSAARNLIASHGYGSNFTHSLGHGIGLEIHEWPTLRNVPQVKEVPLQAGMVITIEPGIYLPGIGGVRLEDTVVITSESYENLTCLPLLCSKM